MSSFAIASIVFGCCFGAALIGMVLHVKLPDHHLSGSGLTGPQAWDSAEMKSNCCGRPRGRAAGALPGSVRPLEHRREASTTPCARRFHLPSDRTASLSAQPFASDRLNARARRDLNSRPVDPKSTALSAELRARSGRGGLSPPEWRWYIGKVPCRPPRPLLSYILPALLFHVRKEARRRECANERLFGRS